MSYESLLIHNCNLGTKSSSQNYLGEWSFSWTYSTAESSCRIIPLSAKSRLEIQGIFDDVKYKVYFPSGTITKDNRLRFNSSNYRVREILHDSSYHHEYCYVSEVQD